MVRFCFDSLIFDFQDAILYEMSISCFQSQVLYLVERAPDIKASGKNLDSYLGDSLIVLLVLPDTFKPIDNMSDVVYCLVRITFSVYITLHVIKIKTCVAQNILPHFLRTYSPSSMIPKSPGFVILPQQFGRLRINGF